MAKGRTWSKLHSVLYVDRGSSMFTREGGETYKYFKNGCFVFE